jgi:hypothetical protein
LKIRAWPHRLAIPIKYPPLTPIFDIFQLSRLFPDCYADFSAFFASELAFFIHGSKQNRHVSI